MKDKSLTPRWSIPCALVLLLALMLALSFKAVAADAGATIRALYDAESSVPGVLIPFRASIDSDPASTVDFAGVVGSVNDSCRVMRDPNIKNIFLLKCLAPAEVTIVVHVSLGEKSQQLTYGPVSVQHSSPGTPQPTPTPGPSDELKGQQLFSTYCISCHQNPTEKKSRSENEIRSAIQMRPEMNGSGGKVNLLWLLNDPDKIHQLSAYLNKL